MMANRFLSDSFVIRNCKETEMHNYIEYALCDTVQFKQTLVKVLRFRRKCKI
jgi:hypothetical protein